ncbi:DUF4870 domain-containing protein [Flavobacterium sp. SM15]|uniref:DUF4870 domain-containing protein n=1 Tax=Flavobacterium sp. SM15 TaxID=2908005 RepID=UPI001EDA6708|nr:DUF4870 domain-containing protein [Flavobacterium sp. SM15]MCG2611145.1 DUF4870 domain-containing protein [Flavobacterium sp. SM15]
MTALTFKNTMATSSERNTATLIHLSTLSQYFIPFGNYFFPLIIWAFKRDKSEFVDYNGKQAMNFQLSMLLYSFILLVIAVPILLYTIFKNVSFYEMQNGNFELDQLSTGNITGIVAVALMAAFIFCSLKVVEFFMVIYAAVKSSSGETFKYPLSISFLK